MWYAVNIYVNCYRGCTGTAVSPIKEFTNMPSSLNPQTFTLGDVYILDKCLQDGNHATSKWDPCAWLGVYISHSTIHSSNVVLVYNLSTGHTMPQFHVVFDDHFQMVATNFSSLPAATIDNLFNTLWTNNEWIYNGDIQPKYLCPETVDIPDMDSTDTISTPNWQLATDLLDDLNMQYYLNGEPPPPTPNQTNAPTQTSLNGISDQSCPSDTNLSNPDQLCPSGSNQIPLDQTSPFKDDDNALGHPNTPRALSSSLKGLVWSKGI